MECNKEIVSSLKFIGRIQTGEKINVKFMLMQPTNLITRIIRTLFNYDNRSNTLNFIQRTISSAFDILHSYEKSDEECDKIMLQHIVNDLRKCKLGMNNLKETYSDDIKFCCDIDTLLQVIEARLMHVIITCKFITNIKVENILNDNLDIKLDDKLDIKLDDNLNEKLNDKSKKSKCK
jgi:hypothetical protein